MIIITPNEKRSSVPKELEKYDVPIVYKDLKIGDYLVHGMPVERKEANDYVSSKHSKHLDDQLYQMSNKYPLSYVIIEGSVLKGMIDNRTSRASYISSLIGSSLKRADDGKSGQIITINVDEPKDTAMAIYYLHKKLEEGDLTRFPAIAKKPAGTKSRQEYILSSFPGIGTTYAKKLLNKFGTIADISSAEVTNLQEIIGKKRGMQLFSWFHKIYRSDSN